MTQSEMIDKIAQHSGIRKLYVSTVVEYLLEYITDELAAGNKVKLAGFGTFEPKEQAAKTGRDLNTNESVSIPARVIPSFKPGNRLKEAVVRTKC